MGNQYLYLIKKLFNLNARMKWTIIASLLGLTQGADWTYDSFGQDWPDKEKACGEEAKNQSPIDLSSTEDKKKWE